MELHDIRFCSTLLLVFFCVTVTFKIVSVLSKSRQDETVFLVLFVQCAVLEEREKAFPMTDENSRNAINVDHCRQNSKSGMGNASILFV